MILIAEQTQLAVGQGGLHLTQLCLGDAVRSLPHRGQPFSLVYDCGGYGSRNALSRGLRSVREALPRNGPGGDQRLDVLVLSHLHADHINGFKRLVAGAPLTIGTLIIPHYDDDHRLILLAQVAASTGDMDAVREVNDVVRDPGGWFGERGVLSVVAVRPGDEDTPPFETSPEGPRPGSDPIDRPEMPTEADATALKAVLHPRGGVERSGRMEVVSPGAYLGVRHTGRHRARLLDWSFVPYCQRWTVGAAGTQHHQAFVQAVRQCLAPYRRDDGSLQIGPADANRVRDCLTAAFLNYVGRKTADSTWNVLSLSLFGGPLRKKDCDRWLLPMPPWQWPLLHGRWVMPESGTAACGWMLTGDSDLTGGAPAWSRFYRALLPLVGIFQLPHHGSAHNSDANLPLGSTWLPFVTCRSGDRKHPAPDVEAFLAMKGLRLARVATDPDSTIRSTVVCDV